MYERFSGQGRLAIQLAAREALRLGHDYVGTEHLLLGVLREGSPGVGQLLTAVGLDRDTTYSRLQAQLTPGSAKAFGDRLPFTPGARRALDYAREEADRLHHASIGPEHLLLGLLREADSNATVMLSDAGLTLPALRQALAQLPEPENRDWQLQPQQAQGTHRADPSPAALDTLVTKDVLVPSAHESALLRKPGKRIDTLGDMGRDLEVIEGQLRGTQHLVCAIVGAVLGAALLGQAGAVCGACVGLAVAWLHNDVLNFLAAPLAGGMCGWLYGRHDWAVTVMGGIAGLFLAACLGDWRRELTFGTVTKVPVSAEEAEEDRESP